MKAFILPISLLVLALIAVGVYLVIKPNSPDRNRQILLEAIRQRDPKICDQIKGSMYVFGDRDTQTKLNQAPARAYCKTTVR